MDEARRSGDDRARFEPGVLAELKGRLDMERHAASARMQRYLESAREEGELVSVGDDLDRAYRAGEITRLLARARRERTLIREIERAIEKVDRGVYGVCEGTGEVIELARLRAQPWARYSRLYMELVEEEGRAFAA